MNGSHAEAVRWVFDSDDSSAHVLADCPAGEVTVLITMCGRELPAATTPSFVTVPSMSVCPQCARYGETGRPPVVFPTPLHY